MRTVSDSRTTVSSVLYARRCWCVMGRERGRTASTDLHPTSIRTLTTRDQGPLIAEASQARHLA